MPRVLIVLALSLLFAAPAFQPVQPDTLTASGSLVNALADFDGNGAPDLFVGFNGAPNRLYRSIRGVMTDVAATMGVADTRTTRAAAWGDYDGDGDADLLVGFGPAENAPVLRLYRNDREKFADATADAGLVVATGAVRQLAWVDLDADHDLDLFVAFRDRPNALFRNTNGKFVDEAEALGLADTRRSVGAVWFDYDSDGDLDLYLANMDGDANALYRNDAGKFTDVAEAAGLAWGGRAPREATNGTVRPCAADVDSDGRFDVFTANYGPNGLFLNRGEGKFDDVSKERGVAIDGRYDACAFADIDHDGRLDLFVNGTVTGGKNYPDYLFTSDGTTFSNVTPTSISSLATDHGAAWVDFDLDGDMDLALTGAGPLPLLLRNQLPSAAARRAWHVTVVDAKRGSALPGAEVRIYQTGTRRQFAAALVDAGSGYNAQNVLPVHLTVPQFTQVDIEVTWPAAGKRVTAPLVRRVDSRRGRITVPVSW